MDIKDLLKEFQDNATVQHPEPLIDWIGLGDESSIFYICSHKAKTDTVELPQQETKVMVQDNALYHYQGSSWISHTDMVCICC